MTSRWSVVLVPSHSHRWTTVVLLDGVQMITSRAPFRALQIKKRWNVVFFFCIEILSMFFFFSWFWNMSYDHAESMSCWKRKKKCFWMWFQFFAAEKKQRFIDTRMSIEIQWMGSVTWSIERGGPLEHCLFLWFFFHSSIEWNFEHIEIVFNYDQFEWLKIIYNFSDGKMIFSREMPLANCDIFMIFLQ